MYLSTCQALSVHLALRFFCWQLIKRQLIKMVPAPSCHIMGSTRLACTLIHPPTTEDNTLKQPGYPYLGAQAIEQRGGPRGSRASGEHNGLSTSFTYAYSTLRWLLTNSSRSAAVQFLGLPPSSFIGQLSPWTVAPRVLASLRIPEAITNSATGFLQPTGLPFSLGEAIVPSSRTPVTQDTHYTFGCPPATFMDQTTTRAHPPLVKIPPLQLLSRSKAHSQQAGPVTSDRTCVLGSTLSPYT